MRLKRKSEGTPFERWGGQEFFDALVEKFYEGVVADPVLRPMYPDDLAESKAHLALFLGQYWGGPDVYNQVRGHPRLRMRHMTAAVDVMGMAPDDRAELLDYLSMAARSLQNAH